MDNALKALGDIPKPRDIASTIGRADLRFNRSTPYQVDSGSPFATRIEGLIIGTLATMG